MSIMGYSDYRVLLRDYYEKMKKEDPGFSYRKFARWAGFSSPSFILSVMNKKSNLSAKSAASLADAMEMNASDKRYFCLLVRMNQAETEDERYDAAEKIFSLKAFAKARPMSAATGEYLSQWYFSAIKEMIALGNFKEDILWVNHQLKAELTAKELREAIDCLLRLGLVERDAKKRLVVVADAIASTDAVTASFVRDYHLAYIDLAKESLRKYEQQFREIQGLTVPVSEKGFLQLKKMVLSFRDAVFAFAEAESQPEFVCQLNLQLFPVSRPTSDTVESSEAK